MKRNLLFISHRLPWPPDKGEKIRAWHILQYLQNDFALHLGCVDDAQRLENLGPLRDICASVGAFPINRARQKLRALLCARPGRPLMPDFYYAPALRRWVDETLARHDIDKIYIYTVAMAPYVLGAGQTKPSGAGKPILDALDIDSEKWTQYAATSRQPMRAVWAREGRTLLAYERAAAAQCGVTLFVSEPEANRFSQLAPELGNKVAWLENGVDLQRFNPSLTFVSPFAPGARALVFTGHMDYWPNADAVTWFARDVLPLLRATAPAAEFWIVGANPGPAVLALAELPGVRVTGRVADTRPYIAHAAACVCPLRLARGIQNKVLEAMAMGRPVVATAAAFEGVRAVPGRDLLVADEAGAFASALAAILAGQYPELGAHARSAMEESYAWPHVLARLDKWLA